jgi:glycosyltransferase involved in cell wall biosynthesis
MGALNIVMLVEGYNAVGGIAEIVDSIATELIRRGNRVAIVSTFDRRAHDDGYERVPRAGVDCIYIEIRNRRPLAIRHLDLFLRPSFYTRQREFVDFLRRRRPDVVNSQLCAWDRYPTVLSACRAAGAAMVQSFHVSDERGRGQLGVKGLAALRHADALIAGSAVTRDFFAGFLPAAREARVIIGGVDLEPNRDIVAHRRARRFVFSAGRLLLEHKAFDLLIDAFALIAADLPDVDLLIAGGGPDQSRIAEHIAARRLQERVILAGVMSREQLRSYYAGAALFALASRPGECMPVVYLEALAAGAPVVATDTGGARELIRDGMNGYVVPEDNPAALAAAIGKLLRIPEDARRMGERGREEVLREYTWARCAERYEEVFRAALERGAAGPKGRRVRK